MRTAGHNTIRVVIAIILPVAAVGAAAVEPLQSLQFSERKLGLASDFENTGEIFLSNPKAWGEAGIEGTILYRKLKSDIYADVLCAAFEVDEKGFCKKDMMLEIFYRDVIKEKVISENRVSGKVVIKSRIDFADDNQYVSVGHLEAEGDGKWKLAHIFLEKTPRQMMRAIEGAFRFRIVTPKSTSKELPISYIRLITMEHQEFVKFQEKDRAERGLKRVEFEPTSNAIIPTTEWKQRGFVVYPVNYLRLVFPNSRPDYDSAGSQLKCFEVPGQAEPVSFVIHAFEDMLKVQVKVSDLNFGTNIIPADKIDIRMVHYNDQRWGWSASRQYGTCPDYLGFENPKLDIRANSNMQFWLTISVPEDASAGTYQGNVTIYANNTSRYVIPLSVEVLPIKLLENKIKHIVYHSPYYKKYIHPNPIKVLEDMKGHGLTPVFYPPAQVIKTRLGVDVKLDGFEYQLKHFREVYPEATELFVTLSDYRYAWRKLNGPKPEFAKPFPRFELMYGKILKKYDDLAKRYGLELYFGFTDEPFKNIYKRRVSYLCSSIARANGLKTWSTHRLEADVPLRAPDGLYPYENLRPLRDVLDVFVEHIKRIDEISIRTFQEKNANLSYYTTYAATSVRPIYNRFLHGIYPFVINSRFVISYAHRDSIADPYDDMDIRPTWQSKVGMNDYLLTYPTWQGDILPTLSYEALREGVEDSCLISTLQLLADKALQSDRPDTIELGKHAYVCRNNILKRISKNFRKKYWANTHVPDHSAIKAILRDLDKQQREDYGIFDTIRREVCDEIIALQNTLYREKSKN